MKTSIAVAVVMIGFFVTLLIGIDIGRQVERCTWSKQFAGYQAERIAREGKRDLKGI